MPDHTLNEEDLKEKRRQRLMKAGYDARIRAKAEKEHDRMVAEEARRKDEEARLTDPQGWLRSVRQKHEASRCSFDREEVLTCRINDRKRSSKSRSARSGRSSSRIARVSLRRIA